MNSSSNNSTKKHIKSTKIFVGGVPPDTNKEELGKYFSRFGVISKIDLPVNKRKNQIKGFAFVTFCTPGSADRAVNCVSHVLRKKSMVVNPALTSSEASKKTKSRQSQKLFIRGIPRLASQNQVRSFFEQFGEVELVIVPKVVINQAFNKGIAYVVMSDKAVFDKLISYKKMNFENHEIEITPATAPKDLKMGYNVSNRSNNSN